MRDILDVLVAKGVPAEIIIKVNKLIEEVELGASRRERDRVRKRSVRAIPRMSADKKSSTISNTVSMDVRGQNPPLNNPPLSIQKPKKVSVSRRTAMPTDWHPVIDMADSAEFDRFVNYCKANAKTYADWDAAWRNWRTSPYRKAGNGHGKQDTLKMVSDLAEQCREREREIEQGLYRPPEHGRGR